MAAPTIQSNLLRLVRAAREHAYRSDCSFTLLPYADTVEIKRQVTGLLNLNVSPCEELIEFYSHCTGIMVGDADMPLLVPASLPQTEAGESFGWDIPSVMGDLHIWPENQTYPGEPVLYTAVIGHTNSATLTICHDGLCSTHRYGGGIIPKPQHFCMGFGEAFERFVRMACRDLS